MQNITTEFGRIKRKFFNLNTGKTGDSIQQVYNGEHFNFTSLKYFLTIGYVPGDLTLFDNIMCLPGGAEILIGKDFYSIKKRKLYTDFIVPHIYQGADKVELIAIGIEILQNIIKKEILCNRKKIVLPITAGLDSRAILLTLLNFIDPKDIETITFGYKGCKDLKGVPKIIKKYKLKHTAVELNDIKLNYENIVNFGLDSDFNKNIIEQPAHKFMVQNYGNEDFTIYSGVLGGSLSGSNMIDCGVDDPLDVFLEIEKKGKSNIINAAYEFTGESLNDYDRDKIRIKSFSFDDYDMLFRHERLILHNLSWNSIDLFAPFTDEKWISFWLSLPIGYRNKRRTFLREIILSMEKNISKHNKYFNFNLDKVSKLRNKLFKKNNWVPKQTTYKNLDTSVINDLNAYLPVEIKTKKIIPNSSNELIISLALINKAIKNGLLKY